MGILIFTFIALVAVTFSILIVASRPSKQQKMMQSRLGQLGLGEREDESNQSDGLLKPAGNSRFASLEDLLAHLGIYAPLQALIQQSDSQTTPGNTVLTCLAMAAGSYIFAYLLVSLVPIQAALTLVAASAPILLLRFKRGRRLKAFNDALPDAIDLMARALRAGHAVASAVEVVAEQGGEPVASEFALVYQQQNFGLPFRDALMNLAQRNQSQDLQFVVTAMLVQKETGGNLAEILDRTTHVIRERLRIHGEIRIKSAQGRLTGWILTLLPIVMGFLINLVNSGFEKPLFDEPVGRMMLYTGAGMLFIGALFIRKIVDIEV